MMIHAKRPVLILLALCLAIPVSTWRIAASGSMYRVVFETAGYYLTLELLDDDLAHFELSLSPPDAGAIRTTPMIAKTDYPGPTSVTQIDSNTLETPAMRLEIDPEMLCVTITDRVPTPDLTLTTLCPLADDESLTVLSFTQEGTTDLYGLGEQFQRRSGTDGNWIGKQRSVLNQYGNEHSRFNGGSVGNAQFPIVYALGAGEDNYALFLDNVYQQYWDFSHDPFTVKTSQAPLRWYILTGPDLPDLRQDYMELTGHPPVPPKQLFGLWVSEFGYESWDELTGDLESLRAARFPLDGFALDLQWFGGITPKSNSQMGSLTWDETHFPDPAAFMASLRAEHGLGIVVIEEPYVSEAAQGYDEALSQGVLVRACGEADCAPVTFNEWWGVGGMVDWTNPNAAAWWHDERRQHLIDAGVIGHWIDLGEPETYDDAAWYYGFPDLNRHDHADIHNVYNLLWSKSIWEGYQRHDVERRPFILSRSGTSGSQRYGVSMWSGDIGSNLPSLAAHMNVQMHMSLSGIDYFGADVGGFHRKAMMSDATVDDVYTIWLANAALIDVPLRPHAYNLQNIYDTSPALIGDVPSNLANVRLRYELSPYLYTLAHRAYRYGDPVFAPLVYYFQRDPNVRELGSQKMIGSDMMMVTITENTRDSVPVYLPDGGWFNYHTGDYFESAGQWIDVPVMVDGVLRAPLFVRDEAVIPLMPVDDETFNILGQRRDGSVHHDLVIHVYSSTSQVGEFTLIEDDGETTDYQNGAVRETSITYGTDESGWFVDVGPAIGTYRDAPDQRLVDVYVIRPNETYTDSAIVDVSTPQHFTSAKPK
jgi:alpha-glucosidase (family GH31 glycosyl hydrolase)